LPLGHPRNPGWLAGRTLIDLGQPLAIAGQPAIGALA